MLKLLPLFILFASVFDFAGANASPLESYRWKARPVIVFGSQDNRDYQHQIRVLNQASAGFRERDMILLKGTEALRRAYGVHPEAFEVFLVGKDGGVKLRSRDLVRAEELFHLVDAMPMRRDEMRRR